MVSYTHLNNVGDYQRQYVPYQAMDVQCCFNKTKNGKKEKNKNKKRISINYIISQTKSRKKEEEKTYHKTPSAGLPINSSPDCALTNFGSTPKNGKVALPGLVGVTPGKGVNILPPVSVCHHVSTIAHLP